MVEAYRSYLSCTHRGSEPYFSAARTFMARWPDPSHWSQEPLERRLAENSGTRAFLLYLMVTKRIRGDYPYLLERKLTNIFVEVLGTDFEDDLVFFSAQARKVGFSDRVSSAMATSVMAKILLHTQQSLARISSEDLDEFETCCRDREAVTGVSARPLLVLCSSVRQVLFHPQLLAGPPHVRTQRVPLKDRVGAVHGPFAQFLLQYLERKEVTCTRKTVSSLATRLVHFGLFVTTVDPSLASPAQLTRCTHIEPYLVSLPRSPNTKSSGILSVAEQARRIRAAENFLREITEWGWPEAPPRQLFFRSDIPRLPRPLPRHLPPDADRLLSKELMASEYRLAADALLLQRACGLRIGELLDLELDCVHELPEAGTWLKIPLGKMKTERMVPLDLDTLALVDRIIATRSQGQPLIHPRTGKPAQFLFMHHGRRLGESAVRVELNRAAAAAGLGNLTPHQLRHTYATALINAGVTLQSLMALLGHVSAEMSLRYASLFDSTVRTEYERALDLAKSRIGLPELSEHRSLLPLSDVSSGSWQETATIKSRLAGGHCLRSPAQQACQYANICEHCPSFRTEDTNLPVLEAQRKDAMILAQDARRRGWDSEVQRHEALVAQLDLIIERTRTA